MDKLEKLYGSNEGIADNNSDIIIAIDGREVFRAMSPYMGRAVRGM